MRRTPASCAVWCSSRPPPAALENRVQELAAANEALRATAEQYRRFLSIGTVGVLFFDLDGRIRDANAAFERMSGYTVHELRAIADWAVLTPPEFMEATEWAAGEVAAVGITAPYEKQMFRRDGSRWWALFAPMRLAGSGRASQCVEFVIDIGQTKEAEAALRASEERYRTLFAAMEQGFAVCELVRDAAGAAIDYRYLELNPAWEQQTGLSRDEALRSTVSRLLPGLDPWWFRTFQRVVDGGEAVRFERLVPQLNRWYSILALPHGGQQFSLLYDDVTERKRREATVAFLSDLSDAFSRLTTAAEIMQATGARIGRLLGVARCHFADMDDAAGIGIITHDWHAAGVPSIVSPKEHRIADFFSEEHCIHAISYIAQGLRLRVASPGWGEVASFAVLQRLRPWIVDRRQTHAWVGTALGLDAYPLIYRDWHRPVSGAILGPVYRLLGGERGQQATFGPPAPLNACAGPAEK